MTRWFKLGLSTLFLAGAVTLTAISQPPDTKGPPKKDGKGKDGKFKGKDGPMSKGPRMQLGMVIPPHIRDELNLTPEQQKKLETIEADVRGKLNKLLTDEQKRIFENHRPPFGPPGGPGGTPDAPTDRPKGARPDFEKKGGPPDRPPSNDSQVNSSKAGGIQWFATLDRGLAEAKRTGKPILYVSAAPHCGGISGIW
jgi:hypothetical protein